VTDAELIASFINGDIAALGALIERHKNALYSYLLRITGRGDVADDILQEVFLKIIRNPNLYKEKNKFRAWLFTIANNAAMDYFRKEASRKNEPLPQQNSENEENTFAAIAPDVLEDGPEKRFENKQLAEKIERALASLSYEQRQVFYMRHYSELSFNEIAEILNLPIGTVLARMSRAADKLRKEIEAMQ